MAIDLKYMTQITKKKVIAVGVFIAPSLALAVGTGQVGEFITRVKDIMAALVPLLMGLLSIAFLYSVIQFALAGGDEKKRDDARKMITYSVVGMFIAVTIWGLVYAIGDFFLGSSGQIGGTGPDVIQIPTTNP